MWVWRSSRWEACSFLLQVSEVCELCMRYRDLFEGMFKTACVCSFELWIYSFLTCHNSITVFEINAFLNQDSYRLLKFVLDLVSIFDTGWFCFPGQLPSARVSDCRPSSLYPCNPWTLQHSPRSLCYSSHHPFGCGRHHLQLTLWNLMNWVSILKKLRSSPPSCMCTLWTLLLNLSIPDIPFPVLLSTLIRSQFQACNPPDPHWFPLSFSRWRSFTVLGTKVALFP